MSSSEPHAAAFTPLAPGRGADVFRPFGAAPASADGGAEVERAFRAGYAAGRQEWRAQLDAIGASLDELAAIVASLRRRLAEPAVPDGAPEPARVKT
ncbi:MAG TPA: hypothetical protein VKA21_08035 [Candidatus Binatia bacterium]|nr:hypothetical protein [Candidatus Binatia bacterium]